MLAVLTWIEVPVVLFLLAMIAGSVYMIFWGLKKHTARLVTYTVWVAVAAMYPMLNLIQYHDWGWLFWVSLFITLPMSLWMLRDEVNNGERRDAQRTSRR